MGGGGGGGSGLSAEGLVGAQQAGDEGEAGGGA